jgi:hypothetical protein
MEDLSNEFSSNKNKDVETQYLISTSNFILLCVLSVGLYSIWWIYKCWRFFMQKDKLSIQPVARTIFSLFFLHSLLAMIFEFAKEKGYSKKYNVTLLFIMFFAFNFLAYLPDPYFLVSIFAFTSLLQPFNALNYAKLNSLDLEVVEQNSFNSRQKVLLVCGSIFWLLMILGIMAG